MSENGQERWRESPLTIINLFAASGTLICCALPIVLVSLGLGSTIIGITTAMPWMITLSTHKAWVFGGSAVLLTITGWILLRPGRACPSDPELARKCVTVNRWNRRIYWMSVAIWFTGFLAAYLALPIALKFGF